MNKPTKPNHVIVIDFETYWADDYTLTDMPVAEYVYDGQFEVLGVGVKLDHDAPWWYPYEIAHVFSRLPWEDATVVAHNAQFDGFILEHVYDIHPARYFCTSLAARPIVAPFMGGTTLAQVTEFFKLGKKGDEVMRTKNKKRRDFTDADMAALGEYCLNDVRLTHMAYHLLSAWYEQNNRNVT